MLSQWPFFALLLAFIIFLAVIRRILPGSFRNHILAARALRVLPQFTASIDSSGKILAVHSIPPDFPFAPEELCGSNWAEFIHKDFQTDFLESLSKADSSSDPQQFQYSINTDSRRKCFRGELIKASKGEFLLSGWDCTEEKMAQEKLFISHHAHDMTTFHIDTESMILTLDREDLVSSWAGSDLPHELRIEEAIELLQPSDQLVLRTELARIMSGEKDVPAVQVKFARIGDTSANWVLIKAFAVDFGSEPMATVIGVIRNVTQEIQHNEQREELNFMLKNILDTIPVGLYWKDTNCRFEGANRVFLMDHGLDSEKFLNEPEFLEEKTSLTEQQVIETGKPVLNRREKMRLPESDNKTFSVSRVPLRSASGGIIGLMGTYMDITETVEFGDQLIRRKEFLSRLVENLPVGFFAKDPSSGMSYRIWNRKMEEIFGFSAPYAVDERDWNLFGTRAATLLNSDDEAFLKDPDSGKTPIIYKLHGRTGIKTVSITRVLLYDDLLDSTLVAGVVDDITRESELENQLRQSQKMEAIGRLAGGVAHDFNNLLQVMMGSAEIGTANPSSAGKSFNQILLAGEKAMFLTRQLLSFSREETFNRRSFVVDVRVGEFVGMVHRIIGEDTRLTFTPGATDLKINGDPFQLEQVLMNLLVNAKDAIPPDRDGLISVETSTDFVSCVTGGEPVECVVISITDNGEGISDDIRSKIFEPFFTTKAEGKGTGLGLASCYGIVARHKGIIKLESSPEDGTRFDVCIPLYRGGDRPAPENLPDDEPEVIFTPHTILLAEDEEMVREIAKTILESAGHTVIEGRDGGEAYELFIQHRNVIDLLIFDAIMPVMNGSEVFQKIHSIDAEIPVLFCTGYSRDTLMGSFPGSEKTDILQKPYAAADLLKAVENLSQKK